MTKYTPDIVKVEVSQLLNGAAISFLNSYNEFPKGRNATTISSIECLQLCQDSKVEVLREFAATTKENLERIFMLLNRLEYFQLEPFISLVRHYRESLTNVEAYDRDDRDEYFLALSFNITQDIQNYLFEYEEMIKKRTDVILVDAGNEVVTLTTSFVFN